VCPQIPLVAVRAAWHTAMHRLDGRRRWRVSERRPAALVGVRALKGRWTPEGGPRSRELKAISAAGSWCFFFLLRAQALGPGLRTREKIPLSPRARRLRSFSSCALRPVRGHSGPLHACKRARSARALITAQNPGQELERHAQAGREQDASTRIHHLQISGARAPELRRADRIPDRRAVFITVQSYKEGCHKFTACDVVV
jgi:hypothetical protein